jgi:hypothetical protein
MRGIRVVGRGPRVTGVTARVGIVPQNVSWFGPASFSPEENWIMLLKVLGTISIVLFFV